MKIFGNKSKLSPDWSFRQSGNLWKFVFAGDDIIAGETRDIEQKKLFLFSLDVSTGNCFMKDFLFEDGNYWVSIEGGNDKILFLNRFRSPELPYPKNIIALDIRTGKKLWENEEYVYYFCGKDKLYGRKSSFEKDLYAVIDMENGSPLPLSDNDAAKLKNMKAEADDDLFREYYDYPKPVSTCPAGEECEAIIAKETSANTVKGDVEYITKNDFLLFNYYPESGSVPDSDRKLYKNVFCIYNFRNAEKLYEGVLNENSNYNVPDNFFMKGGRVFLLKGREYLVSLNLIKK